MAGGKSVQRESIPGLAPGYSEEEYTPPTDSEEPEVWVMSLHPVDLDITSPLSGITYHFPGAGSEVKVRKEDADWLLSLRRGRPCCGGTVEGAKLFQLA